MKNILVVDDNKTNLMSAKAVLSEKYKITAVTQAAQGLRYLQNNICDLILLDVEMPEMDGFEMIQKIKEMQLEKEPPVVFLTGNTDAVTVTRCIESGGVDVIAKPFVKALILARLEHILEWMDLKKREWQI